MKWSLFRRKPAASNPGDTEAVSARPEVAVADTGEAHAVKQATAVTGYRGPPPTGAPQTVSGTGPAIAGPGGIAISGSVTFEQPLVRTLVSGTQYLDGLSRSLPGISAPLVGRELDFTTVREALAGQGGTRKVVVVQGPGGIGKTRLAVEAARAIGTTWVLPTGAEFPAGALNDLPPNAPGVLIIDDAHRDPSRLRGLASLVAERDFDQIGLVLTVRPGYTDAVLNRTGLSHLQVTKLNLAPLDRNLIDRLITDRGISHKPFRATVIQFVQGNPLLAHAACDIALVTNRFGWEDAVDLLRDRVAGRLMPLGNDQRPSDQHRAALVALALRGTVKNAEELTALSGAVSMLPAQPHELDQLLADLADAGLVSSSSEPFDTVRTLFTVRPAVLAPVILADALDSSAHVRLNVPKALDNLLEAATLRDPADRKHSTSESDDETLWVNAHRLSPQLGTLAEAAVLHGETGVGNMLANRVLGLLRAHATISAWTAVLVLADKIAPAAPHLLAELIERLTSQWPPESSSAELWPDQDPATHYRYEMEKLGKGIAAVAEHSPLNTPFHVIGPLMDAAWLLEPGFPTRDDSLQNGLKDVLHPVTTWCATPWSNAAMDTLLEQRGRVLDAITRWARDRRAEPPAGLSPAESARRDARTVARVQLLALQPLLSLVIEQFAFISPQAANEGTLRARVLPDQPRTGELLRQAVSLLIEIFNQHAALTTEGDIAILRTVVHRPRELRAQAARGLPRSSAPLPPYAQDLLERAAAAIEQAIVQRWHDLPLAVRHSAAHAALGGSNAADLAQAARDGDAIAAAAEADEELAPLLVILPPNHYGVGWWEEGPQRAAKAREYGEHLPTRQGLLLLEHADPFLMSADMAAFLTFARAVGASAQYAAPVLERLAHGYLPGEDQLLVGLADSHSDSVWTWIHERLDDPRIAELALPIADSFTDRQPDLHDTIITYLGAPSSRDDTRHAAFATGMSRHLITCRQAQSRRVRWLAALGTSGPADALPAVLAAISMSIDDKPADDDPWAPDLPQRLMEVLARRLREADVIQRSVDFDDDTAFGAAALARIAPAEFAAVLVEQLAAQGGIDSLVPEPWVRPLSDLSPGSRDRVARSFETRLQPLRGTESLPPRAEDAAAEAFTVLGSGTAYWSETTRAWAAGPPSARRRAAAAVRHSWKEPVWSEIVPYLLDTGLDPLTTGELIRGIVPDEINPDLPDQIAQRRAVLSPLREDSRHAVRAFIVEVERRLENLAKDHAQDAARDRQGY